MKKKSIVFICLLTLAFLWITDYPAAAEELEGTYFVKGWNPGVNTYGKESYIGTVTIKKIGKVYQLDWKIANQHHGGVGFYYEDTKRLAIAYADLDQRWFGQVTYTVEGRTLKGIWTVYGDEAGRTGIEILTKQE